MPRLRPVLLATLAALAWVREVNRALRDALEGSEEESGP
jgi:hypothetical protein